MAHHLTLLKANKVYALGDTVPGLFCSSDFDGADRDYLPEVALHNLITQGAVVKELSRFKEDIREFTADAQAGLLSDYGDSKLESLGTWILNHAVRTFAIAIQCSLKPLWLLISMDVFQTSKFTDEALPLQDPRVIQPAGEIWTPDIWTPGKLQDFYNKQWRCLVPVFKPGHYSHNLSADYILPFSKRSKDPKVGAFSAVYKVSVHPEHQKHDNMKHAAIKIIQVTRGNDKLGTDKAWEQEARALSNINAIDHEHIIKCVAAIRRGDNRYFMFPWAEGDSLKEYWNQTPSQQPSPEMTRQVLAQLRGLSDALDRLHNYNRPLRNANEPETDLDDEHADNPDNPDIQLQDENDKISKPIVAPSQGNIRHGDLKPENILRFTDSECDLGVLKIADMGLAKRHIVATQDRSILTSTSYGTIHYEPPEAAPGIKGPRSRLYDIWSMGCITLEFIIWILYGNDDLTKFYNQVKGDATGVCQYYEFVKVDGQLRPAVHHVVRRWIKRLRETDPECSPGSAIGDLLDVVQNKLLVVALPPTRGSTLLGGRVFPQPEDVDTASRYRCTAAEFRDALDSILQKSKAETYLHTGKSRHEVKTPSPAPTTGNSLLTPDAARDRDDRSVQRSNNLQVQPSVGVLSNYRGRPRRLEDYTLPPLENWEFEVDNEFAETLLKQLDPMAIAPPITRPPMLCSRCNDLDFWEGGFELADATEVLLQSATKCDFCNLLASVCENNPSISQGKIQINRNQSNLVVSGNPFPILSICRSPDSKPPTPIQIGLPRLPEPGSELFFTIVRLWLRSCTHDDSHKGCQVENKVDLPTRLIDVGDQGNPSLRLVDTAAEDLHSGDYIALSHPWGDVSKYSPFCTLREDPSGRGRDIEHFKRTIPESDLPATFKDAVSCTRKLGVRYLWIDSLCIIQGPDGDFNEEAKRMEDVFSGAYCVIAASRAKSPRDGFLGKRPHRNFVTFQRGSEKPFYVCATIDNFSRDVIEGSLNKRGWVLQERALARRTIYFTKHQAYFECGNGVRCETLTRMHNNMADFLGDPSFPAKAMLTPSRALKISYFQALYKQYSRLNFTRPDDRPFAIAGLEKRLQKAYNTIGGYGIFDDGKKADGGLFHRSLLWQRGEENGDALELTRIVFPAARGIRVPSWSWMAYTGGIDYADPPFQSAEWETDDIVPPWTRGNIRSASSAPQDGIVAITATVREYEMADVRENEAKLVFDRRRRAESLGRRAQCVVVAKSYEGRSDRQRRYYVLLVSRIQDKTGHEQTFQRIGVGFMFGRFIALNSRGIRGRII